VGQLAAELAKDCAGEECDLPFEITSLSRQGLNMQFNTSESNQLLNTVALRWVNLFVTTYNPNGLAHRAKTYDVDRNPRPWRRVDTT
jgi:predicted AAA+ superfamily ATPase